MKKSRLAVAGALVTGILMIVLFVGFTTENFASTNDSSVESVQLNDNVLAEAIIFDGKCGDDKDAKKKAKDVDKAEAKEEGKCGEGKCGGDKTVKKEAKEESKKETKEAKTIEKEDDGKKEGKCGEGKCGI